MRVTIDKDQKPEHFWKMKQSLDKTLKPEKGTCHGELAAAAVVAAAVAGWGGGGGGKIPFSFNHPSMILQSLNITRN
jgi:hypothetical protein